MTQLHLQQRVGGAWKEGSVYLSAQITAPIHDNVKRLNRRFVVRQTDQETLPVWRDAVVPARFRPVGQPHRQLKQEMGLIGLKVAFRGDVDRHQAPGSRLEKEQLTAIKSISTAGSEQLVWRAPAGTTANGSQPTDWSPDGRHVLFQNAGKNTGWDLWLLPMSGDPAARPLIQTPSDDGQGQFSPDDRIAKPAATLECRQKRAEV